MQTNSRDSGLRLCSQQHAGPDTNILPGSDRRQSSPEGSGQDNPSGQLRLIRVAPDRCLSYREWGDPQGYPVIYAHGTPGCSLEGALFHQQALLAGCRWIVIDRPGIGGSDFDPSYQLESYAADVDRLCTLLGLEQVACLGWSSGGPYTLAAAYHIPERINFTGVLAGYTNFAEFPAAIELLWSLDQRAPRIDEASPALFDFLLQILRFTARLLPQHYLHFIAASCSESDRNILAQPEIQQGFMATQKAAFARGIRGIAADLRLQYQPWGFRLGELKLPVHLYQGLEDRLVPWEFCKHMAMEIPLADCEWLQGEGHMFALQPRFQAKLMATIRRLAAPQAISSDARMSA